MSTNPGGKPPASSILIVAAWWIVAVLLCSGAFFGTVAFENRALSRAIDQALAKAGDSRRVSAPAPLWGPEGVAGIAGRRFILKGNAGTAIVFSLNGGGVSASYVALHKSGKGVVLVLPLGSGAEDVSDRLPAGLKEKRIARIAAAEDAISSKVVKK
jgi:hypothetical protein